MKRRILLRILVALPMVAIAGIVWLTYREMQHEKQNAALIAAIKRDDAPAVIALLDAGADPNAEDLGNKNVSFRQVLAEYWDRVRGRTSNAKEAKAEHYTALMLAMQSHPIGMSETLPGQKRHGANPTILEALLAKKANPNVVRAIIRWKGDPGAPSTPLVIAIVRNDIEAVRLLLANGANVNLQDRTGRHPLEWGASMGRAEIEKVLLDHGADPNLTDNFGDTPLMFAAIDADEKVADLLLKAGANVNARDKQGHTALSIAESRRDSVNDPDERIAAVGMVACLKEAGATEEKTKQDAGTK